MWEQNDGRITTQGTHMYPTWWKKVVCSLFFGLYQLCFWRWRLVQNMSINSSVFESTFLSKQKKEMCNKKKSINIQGLNCTGTFVFCSKKMHLCVNRLLLGVCGVHILLAQPGSLLVSLFIFQPFLRVPAIPQVAAAAEDRPTGSHHCNAKLSRLPLCLWCQQACLV